MNTKILIVEDDHNISELIRLYLEKDGFETLQAYDGLSAVKMFSSLKPDLVLLDIMLPKLDGWGVCREIRKVDKTPIIMLTAKDETLDKITGLDLGADDYISKPFDMKEVLARIRAVLRRSTDIEDSTAVAELSFENLVIDMDAFQVEICGKRVDLPPKELELLNYLASHPNRVFTRNQLLDDVWGFDYFGDSRTVDVHVKRLREKIDGISDKWSLKTVWGVGYKFEVSEKA